MRIPFTVARHAGAAAATAAFMMAAAAPQAPAAAETLFQDVTAASGVESFVPTINRDASPAVFPAFFKAIGEFLKIIGPDAGGLPANIPFCGALGPDFDPTSAEPTCEFGPSAYIGGVLIADFNNDGRNDIFATNAGKGRNALFLNKGNDDNGVARFKDVAKYAGVDFKRDQGSAAVAGDVNNDGWVDLYISNIGFDAKTEFKRTSPAFARLGNLTLRDLKSAQTRTRGYNRLLINRGVGRHGKWRGFKDVTKRAGVRGERSTRSTTPAMVDFDNDGDLDIMVTAHTNVFLIPTPTNFPIWGAGPGALSRRVKDIGCFGDEEADPGNVVGDGVDQNGNCVPTSGPLLFKNMLTETGKLKFTDVTHLLRDAVDEATGTTNVGFDGRPIIDSNMSFDPVWFDYDDDGDPDLFIANDADAISVFRNEGGAAFTFVTRTALIDPGKDTATFGDVGAVGAWMAISHGDVNGDGLIDFYATNAGAGGLAGTAFTQPIHALYINLGGGKFVDAAAEIDHKSGAGFPTGIFGSPDASLGHPAMDDSDDGVDNAETSAGHFAFGGQLFDMDNDGDLDIFNIGNLFGSGVGTRQAAANGGSLVNGDSRGFRVTNRGTLYENEGTTMHMEVGGEMVDVPDMVHRTENMDERMNEVGIDNPFDGRGLAIGDLNGDGYVEVVTYNVSGEGADSFDPGAALIGEYHGGLRIFQNNGGSGNNALVLRLEGTDANRSAFGARVTVDANGKQLVRELSSNTGHRGNASLEMVIGVGDVDDVDFTIEWPGGGDQTYSANFADGSRTCLRVVQGSDPVPCKSKSKSKDRDRDRDRGRDRD